MSEGSSRRDTSIQMCAYRPRKVVDEVHKSVLTNISKLFQSLQESCGHSI